MTSTLATPASIAGPNPDEILAVGFLARYREPTRSNYGMSIRQWYEWCYSHNLRPSEVTRAHIELWARELEEQKGLKVATVAGKLNAVCGLYRFAQRDGYMENNPAQWVKRPTVPRVSTTQGLTRQELFRVVEVAKQSSIQDEAIITILGYNGLRVGELISLNVEDIGRKDGYRTIRFTREKKNGQVAVLPLAPPASWAVDRLIYGRTSGPLFMVRGEVRMDRRGVDRVVKRLVKQAGITKRITPHSMRHTFITLALNAGVAIRDIQNSVGHADPRMISFYDRERDNLARNPTHVVSAFVEGS